MSYMTKYLNQKCTYEKARKDASGATSIDRYGETMYAPEVHVRCRRERLVKDIKTANGSILVAQSRYFLDEDTKVEADDRLDGRVVISVEEYVNVLGKVEGYECYV